MAIQDENRTIDTVEFDASKEEDCGCGKGVTKDQIIQANLEQTKEVSYVSQNPVKLSLPEGIQQLHFQHHSLQLNIMDLYNQIEKLKDGNK